MRAVENQQSIYQFARHIFPKTAEGDQKIFQKR